MGGEDDAEVQERVRQGRRGPLLARHEAAAARDCRDVEFGGGDDRIGAWVQVTKLQAEKGAGRQRIRRTRWRRDELKEAAAHILCSKDRELQRQGRETDRKR